MKLYHSLLIPALVLAAPPAAGQESPPTPPPHGVILLETSPLPAPEIVPSPSIPPPSAPIPAIPVPVHAVPPNGTAESGTSPTVLPREKTLDNDSLAPEERKHHFGRHSSVFGQGIFAGTIIESNSGQETLAGIHAKNDFRLALEHLRLPNDADIVRGGIKTPSWRGFSVQSTGETTTSQDYGNANGFLLFEPALNTLLRAGPIHYFQNNYGLVGGQYLGSRLGGFIINGDVIGNQDTLGGQGFSGFHRDPWYLSLGGNTATKVITSSQGLHLGDRRFGAFNQVWYTHDGGEQGFKLLLSPEFTLDGHNAMDLDQRLTHAGQLGVLEEWSRFDPNYANGRYLVAFNGDRNENTDSWHLGGMFYDQMSKDGHGVENYFWGIGLARARADDCKGWRVIVDQAAPFTYLSERMTLQVDPKTYDIAATLWIGSIAR